MRGRAILSFAAAAGLAGCTTYDGYGFGPEAPPPPGPYGYAEPRFDDREPGRYGDYVYEGEDFRHGPMRRDVRHGRFHGRFEGPGAAMLDPWLAETEEGWFILTSGYAAQGYVGVEVAHRANIWFRRYADADRDMRLTDREIRRALAWAVTGPTIGDLR